METTLKPESHMHLQIVQMGLPLVVDCFDLVPKIKFPSLTYTHWVSNSMRKLCQFSQASEMIASSTVQSVWNVFQQLMWVNALGMAWTHVTPKYRGSRHAFR